MSVIKNLWKFLFHSKRNLDLTFSWQLLFQTRSLFYVLVILYSLGIWYFFPDLTTVFQPIKLQEFVFGENIRLVLMLIVFLWPLMEELLFRAGMKWWWRNVSRLVWAIIFALIKYFLGDTISHLWINSQFLKSILWYGIYWFCVILSFHTLKPIFPSISRIYSRAWRLIFRVMTLAFGCVHLSNYDISQWNYLILLLIIPQILLWIMLWFVRCKRGLWYSILLHMFHNMVQIIPLLLMKQIIWKSTIVTYTPGARSLITGSNPSVIISSLFMMCIFFFVTRNMYNEIKALSMKNDAVWIKL